LMFVGTSKLPLTQQDLLISITSKHYTPVGRGRLMGWLLLHKVSKREAFFRHVFSKWRNAASATARRPAPSALPYIANPKSPSIKSGSALTSASGNVPPFPYLKSTV